LTLPMKCVTSKQMQEIDRVAIQRFRVPSLTLMENAGKVTADIIQKKIKKGESILIIVGKGNNGGDGLVIARYLMEANEKIEIALLTSPEDLSHDAKANWEKLIPLQPKTLYVEDEKDLPGLKIALSKTKYVVDAIFGTGLNADVRGRYEKIIEMVNASSRYVFAVDIPSGLSADTGQPLGTAIRARTTVTFGFPKVGQLLPPGPDYVKRLHVVDIGFPKELMEGFESQMTLITPALFQNIFNDRKEDSHKGSFGHLLTLAGSVGKMGAGWLTSKAALRSGVGLVTYGLPSAAFTRFDTRFPEVMVEPINDKKRGRFLPDSIDDIKRLCQGKDAVALGPGIGTRPETVVAIGQIVSKLKLPLVLDADGINCIADRPQVLDRRAADTILTPHPGEMGRLIHKDAKVVQKDRVGIARSFAKEHNIYLVLKGYRSIVATPTGDIFINPTGNPGMATAGSGDALTGMIGAFLAQKVDTQTAVLAAVYLHGLAGDLSAKGVGEISMMASDLIEQIPQAIKIIRNWQPNDIEI